MLAYWLLFLIFALGALAYSSNREAQAPGMAGTAQHLPLQTSGSKSLLIASIFTVLMIGLRFEVGSDWRAYLEIFGYITREDLGAALARVDPGYAIINWIVGKAGVEIWAVNLVCGALFVFGLLKFAKNQPNPWLAIAVAVPYLIIGVAMGYSRQAVAISLSMVGLVAISKGSFNKFVLWVLLGALFHRTAVILIPIVALAYSRNRFQSVVIGIVGCLIGYYVLTASQGLEHFQRVYVAKNYEAQGAGVRLAMNLPPALIYLAAPGRFTNNKTEHSIWRNFALISAASFVLWILVSSTAALDRMALYILPLQIFVFSRLPAVFSGGTPSRFLAVAVLAYSAIVEFVWLNYSNNAQHWIPYQLYPFIDA